jgi:hypothetical protein
MRTILWGTLGLLLATAGCSGSRASERPYQTASAKRFIDGSDDTQYPPGVPPHAIPVPGEQHVTPALPPPVLIDPYGP